MTRLSDSLRGLADRAPVDTVGISTSAATRRIYRGRQLRAAANATAGVGVAAVIAVAAINPAFTSADSNVAEAAVGAPESHKLAGPAFDIAGAGEFAWGQCGTQPFNADVPALSAVWSLTLGDIDADVEQGNTVTAAVTIARTDGTSATSGESPGTTVMVLWNGIVVGTTQGLGADPAVQSSTDSASTLDVPVDLVNCWDSTPLPAGSYEMVAYQDFYSTSDEILTADGTLSDPGEAGIVGPIALPVSERVVSNTVELTVAGEIPEDPFGAYLSPAAPAIVYPDDYLTPAVARDQFASRVTTDVWDMATGTQRVVKTGDSAVTSDENTWLDTYYGCSADGVTTPSFPAASADWPLVKVDSSIPPSVGVSYGWVVDGNPEVQVSVTNTSDYTLPGFWGQPNTTMYLVKNGKVVAVSYLSSIDPNSYAYTTSTDGLLAPDASLDGSYLWRDVNGCWSGTAQSTVTSGTYTVLMAQDIYVDNGTGGYGGPVMYVDDQAPLDGEALIAREDPALIGGSAVAPQRTDAATSTMIAPAPFNGDFDWLSFQVWTSLGQVTIA